ncbi:DUF1289 domain-containing protein [Allohahella marinimesophila]|uniref:DUF1289 domain-containing protein n=1 Tax=Allohahella marinimesophila TaxID=1054972 RepID=UPI0031D13265
MKSNPRVGTQSAPARKDRPGAEAPVRSPCVSICCLDEDDICVGCYRSGDEICNWSSLNNEQRLAVLEQVAAREKKSGRLL